MNDESSDNLTVQLRYRLERTSTHPVLNPCTEIENIIIQTVLRTLKFDFYSLTCPELIASDEVITEFKNIASSYHRLLEPARLPLVKFLISLNGVSVSAMDSSQRYGALKIIGALVQACCGVIGVPSPLGDLRRPKRSSPYYAVRTDNTIRRALICYCLCRRRYKGMTSWKFCPSTVVPTLYYRYWTDIPSISTINYTVNEESLVYIESRKWSEPNKKLEDFIPFDLEDPFGWFEKKFREDQLLSTTLSKSYENAPRKILGGPPVLFALGRVILSLRYNEEYNWVLITNDHERERAIQSLSYNEQNITFCRDNFEKEFYFMKRQ
jgi:hypothetical protein